jgi:hypothetical protein
MISRFKRMGAVCTACTFVAAVPAIAVAQDPPPAQGAPPPDPKAPAPAGAPAPADTAAHAPPAEPAAEKETPDWLAWLPALYKQASFRAYVDTFYSLNWRFPRPNGGVNLYHPYEPSTGFGLAWFGADLSFDPDPVGGQVSLRLGPAVPNLALGDFNLPGGIGYLQDAFVSWRPGGKDGKFTVYAGKFSTIYGAEVAPSQDNINYTRGALYNLAQPFFHTGLRADWQATDALVLKFMAVNGWNNTLDNNLGKSFGLQAGYSIGGKVGLFLGYMTGPEQADTAIVTDPMNPADTQKVAVPGANGRFRHLIDFVADINPSPAFRILVNGDFVAEPLDTATALWYGASVMAKWQATDVFGLGLRGEILRDDSAQITAPNTGDLLLGTVTLTLEAAPSKYLLVRLDNRVDVANERIFPARLDNVSASQFTTTLGIVGKTK